MEELDKGNFANRKSFKKFAQKAIGSSLSMPHISTKHFDPSAEEKFKATVDKRTTQVYLQLLENRVKKLQRDEFMQNKENDEKKRKERDKVRKLERKMKEEEFLRSVKDMRRKDVEQIREKIDRLKDHHYQLMNDIKTQSICSSRKVYTDRKEERLQHLRIKSEISDLYRSQNYQKAEKIRESLKKLEETRKTSWQTIKSELKSRYQLQIENEKKAKQDLSEKLKSLESKEQLLLQKLGRSNQTSTETS